MVCQTIELFHFLVEALLIHISQYNYLTGLFILGSAIVTNPGV